MVTLQDVARAAGVSPMTVSNVVNARVPVRPETRERVLAAVETLGYRVNGAARNLRAGRTGTIALAVPDLDRPYSGQLADRVVHAGRRRGLRVVVEVTGARREDELDAIALSRVRLHDGVIVSAVGLRPEDLRLLPLSGPVVLLGERVLDARVDHVGMPNVAGARAAVEHLLATGRRRVAVVGAPPEAVAGAGRAGDPHDAAASGTPLPADADAGHPRGEGYRQALAAAGLPVDPALVVPAPDWTLAGGAAAARALLAAAPDVDGVLAVTDTLALGVLRGLADAGRRVPQDVAVVGFDDVLEASYSVPRLSTVAPDHEEIAETAVELLVARIAETGVPAPARDVTSGFRLVVRESSAPAG
ncbi:LacI family DNA-binding transcriptional regulator [Cellulomonas endophytica]|uniref:LacI family DNA-binding transcriptional regulator n=1 Tax=Cellulomonas endophytica TaxID=2494735 RepID=UPI0010139DB6|nr:LacI family DNA-binding transcriptional regulator [Cellulomonas endophytica]